MKSARKIVVLAATFWASVIIVLSLALALDRMRRGEPVDFETLIQGYAFGFAPWLILCPIIYLVSRKQVLDRHSAGKTILGVFIMFILCAAVAVAHVFYIIAPYRGLSGVEFIARISTVQWTFDIFIFGLSYVAGRADGERFLKEREAIERNVLSTRLLKLEREAATLEADELRYRFSSHFLLNALSNILGLVRSGDAASAEKAVLSLAEILKRISRGRGSSLSRIGEELSFVETYIEFQKIRYPDIEISFDIEDDVKNAFAPDFILQPLVENAFKHGMSPGGALSLSVKGYVENDRVTISLSNSIAQGKADKLEEGQGTALTRARLNLCFGEDFDFSSSRNAERYSVSLTFPEMFAE